MPRTQVPTGDGFVQRLEPRSLVLMHGDARSAWRHGIAKRRADDWNGQKIKRQRRVSITFRTIAGLGRTQT
ncbi:alpha-ketoglutarate-dependent dioxygenase AlkB [Candidatus Poriferisodalis sp.]|uniref:alpha-ketoglutarate-dependent dioxygenase AlkB n=1 Tax=Candidatus Poriferisodalis sp. TaxID=3101277 RepID=UPI003B52EE34